MFIMRENWSPLSGRQPGTYPPPRPPTAFSDLRAASMSASGTGRKMICSGGAPKAAIHSPRWARSSSPATTGARARIETRVNGSVVQSGNFSELLFDPFKIVSYVSQHLTLMPGDVIYTGTPGHTGTAQARRPG